MRHDLVGFVVGALEAKEHEEVRKKLEQDPELQQHLSLVERGLEPLSWDSGSAHVAEHETNEYLRKVIELSERMIELAYAGDACRQDAGCGIVFGSLRDKAYKIRKLAETELSKHQKETP